MIDVLIEDGSHSVPDQIKSFEVWADKIKPGGMYIVEDVDGHYLPEVKHWLEKICVAKGFSSTWYDLRNIKNRYDDILGVFIKTTVAE